MCLYSTLRKNKKYVPNKKNGGIIPPILDNRVLAVPTACGNCIECKKQKARNWQVRMLEDVKTNRNGHFVTLTFSNESIRKLIKQGGLQRLKGYEKDNAIATLAVEYFRERWRSEFKKSPRHWLITELGHNGTENIHLHGIIWTNEHQDKITEHWKYGFTWTGYNKKRTYVTARTVNYIIKYITKQDKDHLTYKPKIFTSNGIGADYTKTKNAWLNTYQKGKTKETYTANNGAQMALPIYYRNKIYTEEQREKLWLEKLDKKERWVLGQKIDISNGEQEYWAAIRQARKKNKRLGYGNNTKNRSDELYEHQKRILLQEKREVV